MSSRSISRYQALLAATGVLLIFIWVLYVAHGPPTYNDEDRTDQVYHHTEGSPLQKWQDLLSEGKHKINAALGWQIESVDEENQNASSSSTTPANKNHEPDTLIMYTYSASDWAYGNLRFFLTHGLHSRATFVFILNGASDTEPTDPPLSPHSLPSEADAADLPESLSQAISLLALYARNYNNIHIIPRPNTCFDLGAHGHTLLALDQTLFRTHKYFILVNASVRGPFVPMWSHECWSDAYLRPVKEQMKMKDESQAGKEREVKLVGMTQNCIINDMKHVQSMLLATDQEGMGILLGLDNMSGSDAVDTPDTLSFCPATMEQAVGVEVRLTNRIISHQRPSADDRPYTAISFLSYSWTEPNSILTCTNGDTNAAAGAYQGGDLDIWETMFIKTRWGVRHDEMERISGWLDDAAESGMRRGSWDACAR